MAKSSKHTTGKVFMVEVCDGIRHHVGVRKALESQRQNAFENRDAAEAEKREIKDHDGQEYLEACKRHSDLITEIEDLSARIKWHRNQVDKLVEQADAPDIEILFDMQDEPKPQPKPAKKREKEPEQMSLGDAADAVPEGVDQHLKVAIVELGLEEKFKGIEKKLVTAGFNTVADLAKAIDSPEGLPAVQGIGGAGKAAIIAAVQKFRKAHRKAAREAEKEQEAALA